MCKLPKFLLIAPILTLLALAQAPTFTFRLSSGPFLVAPTAQSVDWAIINPSSDSQTVRVTVYKYGVSVPREVVPPGSLTFNLAAGTAIHNANSVGTVFLPGSYYEVVVEAYSDEILPAVSQWSSMSAAGFIPGTLISSGSFIKSKEPKPPKP